MTDEHHKRLNQLKQALQLGAIDQDTYDSAVTALTAQPSVDHDTPKPSVGEKGVAVSGANLGTVNTGSINTAGGNYVGGNARFEVDKIEAKLHIESGGRFENNVFIARPSQNSLRMPDKTKIDPNEPNVLIVLADWLKNHWQVAKDFLYDGLVEQINNNWREREQTPSPKIIWADQLDAICRSQADRDAGLHEALKQLDPMGYGTAQPQIAIGYNTSRVRPQVVFLLAETGPDVVEQSVVINNIGQPYVSAQIQLPIWCAVIPNSASHFALAPGQKVTLKFSVNRNAIFPKEFIIGMATITLTTQGDKLGEIDLQAYTKTSVAQRAQFAYSEVVGHGLRAMAGTTVVALLAMTQRAWPSWLPYGVEGMLLGPIVGALAGVFWETPASIFGLQQLIDQAYVPWQAVTYDYLTSNKQHREATEKQRQKFALTRGLLGAIAGLVCAILGWPGVIITMLALLVLYWIRESDADRFRRGKP